jgi:hypothetical protein
VVEITVGSREVPWRKSLWQETATTTQSNNNNNNNNNNCLDLHNLLTVNVQRPMTFHYSIYQQHQALVPEVQKGKAVIQKLFTG